ncbi:hypothetical protein HWV00_20850 (plasmid) [Moritella sp. 24]|uniref:hypothetical protein n=1 Tax=Moritella sp. 24 TaxID=2746230 RepID=UPI001BA6C85B|nr:hypothetical protein [Moritella sp. 24]QUM78723.1 hypothetical protein HWV00_20850 [Moritella sp. 24]
MLKPLEKIKLNSQAVALLGQLESASILKRIPLLTELTSIIVKLGGDAGGDGAYAANTNPTQAQKQAGNYKKGRITFGPFNIAIENPKGSTRSGTDENGDDWSITLKNHYGDIMKTIGADGDPVDVFLGDNTDAESVFIVDQIDPATRKFDEHKVMLGFNSLADAKKAYFANYADNWQGLGEITAFKMAKFEQWINGGNTKAAVSYTDGSFQKVDAPAPASSLTPSDYVHMSAVELKMAMFKASNEDNHSLDNIALVFDHWLTINQAA